MAIFFLRYNRKAFLSKTVVTWQKKRKLVVRVGPPSRIVSPSCMSVFLTLHCDVSNSDKTNTARNIRFFLNCVTSVQRISLTIMHSRLRMAIWDVVTGVVHSWQHTASSSTCCLRVLSTPFQFLVCRPTHKTNTNLRCKTILQHSIFYVSDMCK
jgi:hypothetical protein